MDLFLRSFLVAGDPGGMTTELRKRKQLALRGKVVPQRSGRAARFGRDRAHRRSLDPVAARGVDSPRSLLPLIADGVRIVNISSREQRFRSAW
jgi:hypothetical protein